jgi:hypothetical protein
MGSRNVVAGHSGTEEAMAAQHNAETIQDMAYAAELRAFADHQKHLRGVALIEEVMRTVLAAILVIGLIGIIAFGVSNHTDPKDLSLLLSPLAGLAGLALGYFFGRAPDRRELPPSPSLFPSLPTSAGRETASADT